MAYRGKVLVVDDEEGFCELLDTLLTKEGFEVETTTDPAECQDLIQENDYDLVFLDLKMSGSDGLQILRFIKEFDENIVVIMVTAYGTIESAVEAMKYGAYDYVTKPFQKDEFLRLTRKAWDKRKLLVEMSVLREEIQERYRFRNIVGKSRPMQQLFELIRRAARGKSTVLI